MRCHICNADSDFVVDEGDGHFSPCSECQTVIYDTVTSYDDQPSDDEDDDVIILDDNAGDDLLVRENFYGC